MTGIKVMGDLTKLFKQHSDIVDYNKALLAIDYATELSTIDIEEINETSSKGGIYVTRNGTVFDNYGFGEDKQASYKIVPTGLTMKFTGIPILASFYKEDDDWKGVYIGTVDKLFKMYKKFYRGTDFSEQYTEYFAGDNGCKDLKGFGLSEVIENWRNRDNESSVVYSSNTADDTVTIVSKDKLTSLKDSLAKAEQVLKKKISKSQRRKTEQKIANLKREIQRLEEVNVESEVNNLNEQSNTFEDNKIQSDSVNSTDEVVTADIENTDNIKNTADNVDNIDDTKSIADNTDKTNGNSLQAGESDMSAQDKESKVGEEKSAPKKRGRKKKVETVVETPIAVDETPVAVEEVETPVTAEETQVPKKRGRKKKVETAGEISITAEETTETATTKKRTTRKSVDKQELEDIMTKVLDSFVEKMQTVNVAYQSKEVEQVETAKADTVVDVKAVSNSNAVSNSSAVDNTKTTDISKEERAKVIESELAEISVGIKDDEAITLNEVCTEIYNRLLSKEKWVTESGNKLVVYIKSLLTYVWNKIHKSPSNSPERESGNGYVVSTNKKKLLVNTNLIDVYGNSIYIIDHSVQCNDFYKKVLTVMSSKSALVDEGFKPEIAKKLPGPVLFGKKADFIFDATIEDFDLEDEEHLNHIINDRRYRFPDKYKDESASSISTKLKHSIEQALTISQMDYRYILPMYNLVRDEIEFLIPFHLDTHYGEKPELAIIVSKKKNFWKIFTIISSELAYDNIRLICNPNCTWAD